MSIGVTLKLFKKNTNYSNIYLIVKRASLKGINFAKKKYINTSFLEKPQAIIKLKH